MPEPSTLTFHMPHEIDGDPEEVVAEATSTLRALIGVAENYAAGTEKQLRNLIASELIKHHDEIDADLIEDAFENSGAAGQLVRLRGMLDRAEALAEALESDVK